MESPIKEFFKNKSIFVTGASGFIGHVCIEKLLRCCDVSKIYILLRNKKDQFWQDRINELCKNEFFDVLRKHKPNFRNQIIGIVGDCALPDLGLSEVDRNEMQQNVNIVFHCAATVKFDERLSTSIKINVRGTLGVINLCKQMKNLEAFVHCSTAFSNSNRDVIDEKFYKPKISGNYALEMLDQMDDETLDAICDGLKGNFPNTYCFTKNLAEDLIRENCHDLPVVVFRPGIVLSTYKEPCTGWINNYYGPIGVLCGVFQGIIRIYHAKKQTEAVVVPVDFAVNAMIAAAADVSLNKHPSIPIYNFVSHRQNKISYGELLELSTSAMTEAPTIKALWFLNFKIIDNQYLFKLAHVFFHLLPALFIDLFLCLNNNKLRLRSIYKKVVQVNKALRYFATRDFTWDHSNVTILWQKLSSNDKEWLNFDTYSIDWKEFFENQVKGMRYYLLKDSPETLEAANKKQKKFKIAHYMVTIPFKVILMYFLYILIKYLI